MTRPLPTTGRAARVARPRPAGARCTVVWAWLASVTACAPAATAPAPAHRGTAPDPTEGPARGAPPVPPVPLADDRTPAQEDGLASSQAPSEEPPPAPDPHAAPAWLAPADRACRVDADCTITDFTSCCPCCACQAPYAVRRDALAHAEERCALRRIECALCAEPCACALPGRAAPAGFFPEGHAACVGGRCTGPVGLPDAPSHGHLGRDPDGRCYWWGAHCDNAPCTVSRFEVRCPSPFVAR